MFSSVPLSKRTGPYYEDVYATRHTDSESEGPGNRCESSDSSDEETNRRSQKYKSRSDRPSTFATPPRRRHEHLWQTSMRSGKIKPGEC